MIEKKIIEQIFGSEYNELSNKKILSLFKFLKIKKIGNYYVYDKTWFNEDGNIVPMCYFWGDTEHIEASKYNDSLDIRIINGKHEGKTIKDLIYNNFNFVVWVAFNPYLNNDWKVIQTVARYWVSRIEGDHIYDSIQWDYKLRRPSKTYKNKLSICGNIN